MAARDPVRRREIAKMGGQTAQRKGVGHRYNTTTGRAAARKQWNTVNAELDRRALIADAAEAIELFSEDELEQFAADLGKEED